MDLNITNQGTPGSGNIGGIGETPPVTGGTQVSGPTDSVSSGGGGSSQIAPNPNQPNLPPGEEMSSAQLWELIMKALRKGRKQGIQSDQENSRFKLSTNINVTDVSTTYIVQDPKDKNKQTTVVVTTQELNLETKSEQILEANLVDVIFKAFKQKYTKASPLNIDAEKAAQLAIYAYTQLAITSALWAGATVAESFLNLPGTVNNVNLNPTAVGAAEAIGFSQYIMGLVKSGDIQNFADKLFPDDPKAAKAFAAVFSGVLLEFALNQTSSGLGLPGLAEQVELQALIVRKENKLLANPLDVALISSQVVLLSTEPGVTPIVNLESMVARAIAAAMEKGPFFTREALQTELKTQFSLVLPDNPVLANLLAENTESATLALAVSNLSFFAHTFDSSKVNFRSVEDSIVQTMQRDFAASDEAIRLSAKQHQKVHDILMDVLNREFTSEQAVRNEIKEHLLNHFENLTKEQADDIVAGINFGLTPSGPLYAQHTSLSITPSLFQTLVETGYQDQVHVAPNSEFGLAINNVAGLSTEDNTSSMVALLNQSYYGAGNPIDKPDLNYLNLTGQDLVDFQNSKIGNSGAQIVMMFGEVINGGSHYKNNTQPPLAMTAG